MPEQAGCIWKLSLTGDRKVPRTRRQACRRHVARAFQPAGSGDFPVAIPIKSGEAIQGQYQDAPEQAIVRLRMAANLNLSPCAFGFLRAHPSLPFVECFPIQPFSLTRVRLRSKLGVECWALNVSPSSIHLQSSISASSHPRLLSVFVCRFLHGLQNTSELLPTPCSQFASLEKFVIIREIPVKVFFYLGSSVSICG